MLVATAGMVAWETLWRAEGVRPAYRNSDGQWAEVRRKVDRDAPGATVLIGSSRMLFDIDLTVWEDETGARPIQLALEGSNPLPVLTRLADDDDFDGLLLVGVTPPLVMQPGIGFREGAVERYETETPSEWIGTKLSYPLERTFAFYTPDAALFTVLERQDWWPVRAGFTPPPPEVRNIAFMDRDRNTELRTRVVTDTAFNRIVTSTWRAGIESAPPPPPEDEARRQFEALLAQVAEDVGKIRERGGEVVFVRLPSSGFFRDFENQALPRERLWEPIVAAADAVGVHFEDHRALQVPTPEWSHVAREDKAGVTRAIIEILRRSLAERGVHRPELGS